MKRFFTTLLTALISFFAVAQNSASSKDALLLENLFSEVYTSVVPRYKLYETEFPFNFIKLDTATGRVWQVQYTVGTKDSKIIAIDDNSLLSSSEDETPGRYELYSTAHLRTLILLDTKKGDTYLVHWSSSDADQRYRESL